jgi:hypothetical protein
MGSIITGDIRDAASFALYILSATVYSTYACGWVRAAFAFSFGSNLNTTQDYLTDWSVLRITPSTPYFVTSFCVQITPVSESLKELT